MKPKRSYYDIVVDIITPKRIKYVCPCCNNAKWKIKKYYHYHGNDNNNENRIEERGSHCGRMRGDLRLHITDKTIREGWYKKIIINPPETCVVSFS